MRTNQATGSASFFAPASFFGPAMVRQSFEVDGVGGGVAGVEVAAEVEFEVEVVADEEVGAVEVVVTGLSGGWG